MMKETPRVRRDRVPIRRAARATVDDRDRPDHQRFVQSGLPCDEHRVRAEPEECGVAEAHHSAVADREPDGAGRHAVDHRPGQLADEMTLQDAAAPPP